MNGCPLGIYARDRPLVVLPFQRLGPRSLGLGASQMRDIACGILAELGLLSLPSNQVV